MAQKLADEHFYTMVAIDQYGNQVRVGSLQRDTDKYLPRPESVKSPLDIPGMGNNRGQWTACEKALKGGSFRIAKLMLFEV
jgi:hypothetical protein